MKRNPVKGNSISHAVVCTGNISGRTEQIARAVRRSCSLIHHSLDILAVVDRQGILQFINPAMESLLGHADADILSKPFSQLIHEPDRASACAAIERANVYPSRIKRKWQLIHLDGGVRIFEVSLQNLLGDPDIAGILVTLHDVTAQHRLEAKLVHQAFHDALTGLPNRALFFDRVRTALKRAKRSRTSVGLLFIDIVDFKAINDRFGHVEGDRVLVELATRLNSCLRSCDTIARMGGDEFTILVDDLGAEDDLVAVVEAINASLRVPITISGQSVVILASIGVAMSDSDSSADSLLSDADAAMYVAKGSQAIIATFRRSAKSLKTNPSAAELR